MKPTEDTLKQLNDPALTVDERATRRCRLAASLTHTGQYEAARDALGGFWQGIGQRPDLKGLKPVTAAEVLLQCGALSGWLGSVRQIPDAQERAKDLLSEALRKFRSQGQKSKASEAQYELGMCYFRLGAYDEARVVLNAALAELKGEDAELKAKTLIRRTLVEVWTGRHHEALDILKEAQPFFEGVNDAIKGRWHGQMALVLRRMATAEGRDDYADRAIIEYTAAAYHLERAGHEQYCAVALNNLAFLLYKLGRYAEAHENLDRAARLFNGLKDEGMAAQVRETRARVFVSEGKYQEAIRIIADVIKTFERSGEHALLADALTIRGVALARAGNHEESISTLRRAFAVAQDAGASPNAAHAALALIEEHGQERLSDYDLYQAYRRADNSLKDTQDAEDIARLRACARTVISRLSGEQALEKGFSLRKVILAYEARFIEQALRATHGSVTRAAKMLGMGYQTLAEILNRRHKKLQRLRTPPLSRKRTGEQEGAAVRAPRNTDSIKAVGKAHVASILVVEDHPTVADAVRETLELEGWHVELCADGASAAAELEGGNHFDLLIFDYQLPDDVNGVELIRLARSLPHRQRTPIVMLSASEAAAEARAAGADVFMRKPQDIGSLAAVVSRLLSESK